MAKRIAAKHKIDRRLGVNLWGRPKSPLNNRQYGPGQQRQRQQQLKRNAKLTPTDIDAAMAALDRITIPEEARERISELVLPGSSLIVSDEEAHKETGKQTGFVVLISGEPQGAIAERRRNDWEDDYYGYDSYYERRERRRERRRMRRRGPGGWW